MSNHSYVKTKKKIFPQQIDKLLKEMNQKYFKGNLSFEYLKSTRENPCWGKHTWLVRYISNIDGKEYAKRAIFSTGLREFEVVHGGAKFDYWLDEVILNEVAVFFNGLISTDSFSGECKGKKDLFPTYVDYIKSYTLRFGHDVFITECNSIRAGAFHCFCPPEFFPELDEAINENI